MATGDDYESIQPLRGLFFNDIRLVGFSVANTPITWLRAMIASLGDVRTCSLFTAMWTLKIFVVEVISSQMNKNQCLNHLIAFTIYLTYDATTRGSCHTEYYAARTAPVAQYLIINFSFSTAELN
jgi:hypothetical protein